MTDTDLQRDLAAALARAEAERDEARNLVDRLKLEAQIWSMEARGE